MNYDWNLRLLLEPENLNFLLSGFWVTIKLTLYSLIIGTPLGILIGSLACLGSNQHIKNHGSRPRVARVFSVLIRLAAIIYIDVVRAIPLLLLILLAYYGLPKIVPTSATAVFLTVFGDNSTTELNAFQTSVVALSVNLSAFLADLVRGAVAGVPQGLVFAGRSLGMNHWLVWRRIVLPGVIREIVPGVTMLYITIFKMSTLCSIVAVQELLHTSETLIQSTYKPLEFYLAVCIFFVVTIVPLSILARWLEKTSLFRRRFA